jgi:hypothetical protein
MIPVVQSSLLIIEAEEHVAPCMRQSKQAAYLERLLVVVDWVNYLSQVALSYSVPVSCDISSTQETCGSGTVGHCCSFSSRRLPWSGSRGVEPHASICANLSHSRADAVVDIKRRRSVDASSEWES